LVLGACLPHQSVRQVTHTQTNMIASTQCAQASKKGENEWDGYGLICQSIIVRHAIHLAPGTIPTLLYWDRGQDGHLFNKPRLDLVCPLMLTTKDTSIFKDCCQNLKCTQCSFNLLEKQNATHIIIVSWLAHYCFLFAVLSQHTINLDWRRNVAQRSKTCK